MHVSQATALWKSGQAPQKCPSCGGQFTSPQGGLGFGPDTKVAEHEVGVCNCVANAQPLMRRLKSNGSILVG